MSESTEYEKSVKQAEEVRIHTFSLELSIIVHLHVQLACVG